MSQGWEGSPPKPPHQLPEVPPQAQEFRPPPRGVWRFRAGRCWSTGPSSSSPTPSFLFAASGDTAADVHPDSRNHGTIGRTSDQFQAKRAMISTCWQMIIPGRWVMCSWRRSHFQRGVERNLLKLWRDQILRKMIESEPSQCRIGDVPVSGRRLHALLHLSSSPS